eukprot:GEMP01024095.1.p1 GENE.GEMP01024095.1~~GEMP01024095.1.p1  ORF type:complete len:733 (+),score=139.14 GEMP01024095.1:22-2220(+)
MGDSAPSTASPRRKRRVQTLLNAYYHVDDEKEASNGKKQQDADSIDAPGFDGEAWVKKLLELSDVNSLVKRAAELDQDVTNLDSDMQMLVYENYSKFIRATDTIRSLKDAVDDTWQQRLSSLKTNLDRMNGLQEDISKHLCPRARIIERHLQERTLLRKALHLFQVPGILRTCLKEEKYGQAASTYCHCIGFLRANQHIVPFREVFTSVEACMQQLEQSLEQKLSSSTLQLDEAVHCAMTLQELNHRDQSSILNDFATGRKAALQELFASLNTPGAGLRALTTKCLSYFIPVLLNTAEGARKLTTDNAFLEQLVEDITSILLDGITSALDERPASAVLRSCLDSLRDASMRLHDDFPQVLDTLFSTFFLQMVQSAVQSSFDSTLGQLITHFTELHAQCLSAKDDEMLDKIGSSEHAMLLNGCVALTEARPLLDIVSAQDKTRLVGQLISKMQTFFDTFNEAVNAYSGKFFAQAAPERVQPVKDLTWCPAFCLALVRIARHLEVRGIAKLYSVAEELFGSIVSAQEDLERLQQNVRGAAQSAMDYCVFTEGARLSHMLRNSIDTKNWLGSLEPSAPRMVCGLLLKEVHQFDQVVSKVLGDPRRPRGDRRRQRGLRKNLEVQLMLAKSVQTFTTVPFNRNGALFSLLKIIIKAFSLFVRDETFENGGVQQAQVDVAFLNDMFRDFVDSDDVNILDGMCNEVVSSCERRCENPQLLDQTLVENLVDDYKQKFEYC